MSVGGFGLNGIVTNGLVLNLDAANRRSFVSGSTSWHDLSGRNNTGTLTGGVTYNSSNGGSLVFNGSNGYVLISNNGYNLGVTFTLQIWTKITRFGGGPFSLGSATRAVLMSNAWDYTLNQGFWFGATSQAASSPYTPTPGRETFFISLGQDQYSAGAAIGSLTPYVNNWVNLSAVVNGTNPLKLYINGVEPQYLYQLNGPSSISYVSGKKFTIGANVEATTYEYMQGSISNPLVYNRALTATEILQNYNTLKNRYQ